MPSVPKVLASALCALLLLGACATKNPKLLHLRSTTTGPDEFGILPPKKLDLPSDLSALPSPTPGGANLADPTPNQDAIVALGGSVTAVVKNDAALKALAKRVGYDENIRTVLASEDAAFRASNNGRLLERAFSINTYFRAYADMSLDQYAELARWQARGLAKVSAPPAVR
jgi:hypothetical protein